MVKVGVGIRLPLASISVTLQDAHLAGRTFHDPGMLHAFDRDAARGGDVVRRAIVTGLQPVLFEPGDGKTGIGVELALDTRRGIRRARG